MKAFLTKYSGLTHSLAGAWLFLVGAYTANVGGFRDIVNADVAGIYHSLPANLAKIASGLFALAVPLWAFYRNGQKTTTVTAEVLPGETGTAKASATAKLSALLICTLLLTSTVGCVPPSISSIENDINTVLDEATNVLVVADPNAAWVPQLQSAITALKTAEASWSAGGAEQIVIDALNTVEAITAVIPLTAAYSPLIDVLVAGIEAVMELFPASATPLAVGARLSANPHVGRVKLVHHAFHSRSKEFKALWNETALANTGLRGATIQ